MSAAPAERQRINDDDSWSARLEAYRWLGDPEVDAAIADYRARHPDPSDLRPLVRAVIDDLPRAKSDRDWCPQPLRAMEWQPPDLPPWAHDHELIERGQAVFNARGLEMGAALVFAALPMAYAAVHGAEGLGRTSDFATSHLTRRVAETGQMLIDVMGTQTPDTLDPGGRGFATTVGLRLLHSCVRGLLSEERYRWPTDVLGVPLNQEIMLATLMDFTVVTWAAMERMGVELSEEDRRAHLYTWSVIGAAMGLDACQDGPLTLADAVDISTALHIQLEGTPAGRRLMAALLTELERYMPLGLHKLPRSLVWWLFAEAPGRTREVPAMLAVPRPASWSRPLFGGVRAAHRLPSLLQRPVDRVTQRAGRLVFTAFVDGWATEAPPFEIPRELQQSWHIRSGRVSKRVRTTRQRTRQQVRATGARVRHGHGRRSR